MAELEVFAAYDRSTIATLPMQDEAECLATLDRSAQLYQDRDAWLPKHRRIEILRRAAQLIENRKEELVLQAAREGGKPYRDSQVEVQRGIEGIETALAELHHFGGTEIPMALSARSSNRMAYTFRDPRGVILSLSAFNHPFNLIVHQVVPALAVGAPVIVKPASDTPLSCRSLVDIFYEAGLPEDWCRMLVCDNATSSKLVADSRVSFLSFIGSARVGWMLRSTLAPGAACALEHGGVAPAIVDATADLDDAVPRLVKGGFYHAGQVCVSVQRIYVHASIRDRFLEQFVAQARSLRVGDPQHAETDVGPLIRPREVDRVDSWVQEAIAGGGVLQCGGERLSETCYAPTVILNPADDAKVSSEEVFGPVVCVYDYEVFDDAIARANAPDTFFQASMFTTDLEQALRAHRRLKGMAVMVNDHTAFRVDWMPFAGHRTSGLGTGGIGHSMQDMSLERMVVFRSNHLP
ncbi:MAG: aldehyde dehydrogenase family protein [Myxococcota bacterium]